MDKFIKASKIGLVIALCLTMVACSQAQILTDLEFAAVAAAAVAAVPGLPPNVVTSLTLAVTSLDCMTTAIQAGGSAAVVATSIAACGLTAIPVPVGTPGTIVNVLIALNKAIAQVLKDQAQITPATVARFGAGGQKFSLGHGGKARAEEIRKQLADTKAKLKT